MFITVNRWMARVADEDVYEMALINPASIKFVHPGGENCSVIVFRDKQTMTVKEEFYVVRGMIQNAHRNVTEVRVS